MFTDLADAVELDSHLERAAELRQMVDPVWSGIVAHRGLAPTSAFAEKDLEDALKPTMVSVVVRNQDAPRVDPPLSAHR